MTHPLLSCRRQGRTSGKEFAEHPLIGAALEADVYVADPHSPWQRGSNENANGLTRQSLPCALS